MTDDADIWRSANLLIAEHGSNALIQAGMRVAGMMAKGDVAGAILWKRIMRAVDDLQRQQRRHDEGLN